MGPYITQLYFLDDGSLIIDKHTSITYIPSDRFEIVRTVGCNYLSNLTGKEVYDLLNNENNENIRLDPNGLSSNTKREECMGTGAKKVA